MSLKKGFFRKYPVNQADFRILLIGKTYQAIAASRIESHLHLIYRHLWQNATDPVINSSIPFAMQQS